MITDWAVSLGLSALPSDNSGTGLQLVTADISLFVAIDNEAKTVTITIPQSIPDDRHAEFERALEELETKLEIGERSCLDAVECGLKHFRQNCELVESH